MPITKGFHKSFFGYTIKTKLKHNPKDNKETKGPKKIP